MYVYETTNRDAFLSNRPPSVPIRVVRMATAQAVRRGATVQAVPAVELTYSFVGSDKEWVYREVRLADAHGRVDLAGTLWSELETAQTGYELVQRSGSF